MSWRDFLLFLAAVFSVVAADSTGEPSLRIMAKSRVYNVGEQKAIYCQGVNLKDVIDWYDPSDKVVEVRSISNNRIFVERMRDETAAKTLVPLIIQSAQLGDSGNWTCKSGELSATIDIIVGEKVVMDKEEDTYEGEEGRTARIDCRAKGSPKPTVQWYKDGTQIQTEDNKKYVMNERGDKYSLEIKAVDHLDSGEYMCKFTQEQLSYFAAKRIQVSILHKPLMIDAITQEFFVSRLRSVEVYAILNETKNITCLAKANPAPTFTWVKKRAHDSYSEEIKGDDTVFNAEDGGSSILMLRLFNDSVLGEYKCTATNVRGSTATLFHVSLGDKPTPPDYVGLVNASVNTLFFNVTCTDCNFTTSETVADKPDNLPILGYTFQVVQGEKGYDYPNWNSENGFFIDRDIINSTVPGTIFGIDSLPNKTRFFVRVRTRNAAGFSDWVEAAGFAETTDFAANFVASTLLIVLSILLTRLG